MSMKTVGARIAVAAVLLVVLAAGSFVVRAEEVKNRWRFDIQIGGLIPGGRIDSNADNAEVALDGVNQYFIPDPRNIGVTTDSRGQGRIELHASYGLWGGRSSELLIDLGVGYYETEITGIELSYMFDLSNPSYYGVPGCETLLVQGKNGSQLGNCTWFSDSANNLHPNTTPDQFRQKRIQRAQDPRFWTTENVTGGNVIGYPVTIDMLFRFRPTKRFNPYLGAGVGYLFVEFDESTRWRQIQDELEGSLVSDTIVLANRLTLDDKILEDFAAVSYDVDGTNAHKRVQVAQLGHRMKRPEISTPDTPFVQARGGLELQFAPKWAWFVDAKFFWAVKDITITADGQEKWGSPTPSITVPLRVVSTPDNPNSGYNPQVYPQGGLPAYIIEGGLRQPAYNPNNPSALPLGGEEGQPGQYYLNGGILKYGGWVFMTGVRFTL